MKSDYRNVSVSDNICEFFTYGHHHSLLPVELDRQPKKIYNFHDLLTQVHRLRIRFEYRHSITGKTKKKKIKYRKPEATFLKELIFVKDFTKQYYFLFLVLVDF